VPGSSRGPSTIFCATMLSYFRHLHTLVVGSSSSFTSAADHELRFPFFSSSVFLFLILTDPYLPHPSCAHQVPPALYASAITLFLPSPSCVCLSIALYAQDRFLRRASFFQVRSLFFVDPAEIKPFFAAFFLAIPTAVVCLPYYHTVLCSIRQTA